MKFRESALAHKYLDGLSGIEIGGSAHNPFGLSTINVDKYDSMDTIFKRAEEKMCGEKLTVDVVAVAWQLPFEDKSFDFVLNSHVIEHCWNPIATILEWARVSRKFIFFNVPHRDRSDLDRGCPITELQELIDRHDGVYEDRSHIDVHHNRWITSGFIELLDYINKKYLPNLAIVEAIDVDDKVGNGFMVVVKL